MQKFENIFLNKEEAMNPKNYYKQFLNYIDQITRRFIDLYSGGREVKNHQFYIRIILITAGLGLETIH